MATEKAQNLQDTFLNHVRKAKTSVTIFLVNGVKLQGFVTWFDNFCVLLRRDGHSQLVYKHAISTIMPASADHDVRSGRGRRPTPTDADRRAFDPAAGRHERTAVAARHAHAGRLPVSQPPSARRSGVSRTPEARREEAVGPGARHRSQRRRLETSSLERDPPRRPISARARSRRSPPR